MYAGRHLKLLLACLCKVKHANVVMPVKAQWEYIIIKMPFTATVYSSPLTKMRQYYKSFQWKGVHTGAVAVTVAALIIILQLKQTKKKINPALSFQLRRQALFITPPKIISLCFEVWFEASAPNLLSNLGLFDDPLRLLFCCINWSLVQ